MGHSSPFSLVFLSYAVIGFFKNRRTHKKLIPALLVIAEDLCKRKLFTVARLRDGSRQRPPTFTSAAIMPFDVAELQRLQAECLWHFGNFEKRAFDSICFHMRETDTILRSANVRVERWRDSARQPADTQAMIIPLEEDLSDAHRQLTALQEWLEDFQSGRFERIMNSEHVVPATVTRPIR